jgi:hypothetical protein
MSEFINNHPEDKDMLIDILLQKYGINYNYYTQFNKETNGILENYYLIKGKAFIENLYKLEYAKQLYNDLSIYPEVEGILKTKYAIDLSSLIQNTDESKITIDNCRLLSDNLLETVESNNNLISEQDAKIKIFIDYINYVKKEINQFEYNIEFAKNEIKNYRETIEKYIEQQRKELIREEYQNCIHRDGIPSTLLKKLIPKVNMYLQGYTEDIDFNVFFDSELFFQMSKKDTPEIIQNVISGSGMERVFACICLRLALRFMNNRSRPNILLLDELFGKLSERNAINFINLMNKVKQDIDKILIIEHAYGDIINPDYLIMVDKDENGNSFVEFQN